MKAIVKFSVGVAHPLYNVPVEAEIVSCVGYNNMGVSGTTISKVYYPADPKGLVVFKNGHVAGYKESPAKADYYEGWIKEIFLEDLGKWISSKDYCEYLTYLKLKAKFEKSAEV